MDLNLFNLVEIVTHICFHVPNSLGFIKQRLHYAYAMSIDMNLPKIYFILPTLNGFQSMSVDDSVNVP